MLQQRRDFYLPDHHEFEFIASVPLYNLHTEFQFDWIHAVSNLEFWLNHSVGSHYVYWAWANAKSSSEAAVAFRLEKHKTFFLLKWGMDDSSNY